MQNVVINILNKCLCSCPGCWVEKSSLKMSLDDFRKIINKLPKSIDHVVISGGEPFIHPELMDMVRYCSDNLCKPSLFTSGVAAPKDLKKLSEYVYDVTVTIKFPNSGDDWWKHVPGSLEKSVRFLEACKRAGIDTNINWCVGSNNMLYKRDMLSLAADNDSVLCILRYIPYDDGFREFALKDEEWEDLCKEMVQYKNVRVLFPSHTTSMDCIAGIHRMSILPSGEVSPCLYWSFSTVGNILNEDYKIIEKKLEDWRVGIGDIRGCPVLKRLR